MDATRPRRPTIAIAASAIVIGILVYGAIAILGGDDTSDRADTTAAGSVPTSSNTTQPSGRPPGSTLTTAAATSPGSSGSAASSGSPAPPGATTATAGATPGAPQAATPGSPAEPGSPGQPAPSDSLGAALGAAAGGIGAAAAAAAPPPDPAPASSPGAPAPSPSPDPAGSGDPTPTDSVYDSEDCVLFRQLLGLVDNAELRAAAASVGCI